MAGVERDPAVSSVVLRATCPGSVQVAEVEVGTVGAVSVERRGTSPGTVPLEEAAVVVGITSVATADRRATWHLTARARGVPAVPQGGQHEGRLPRPGQVLQLSPGGPRDEQVPRAEMCRRWRKEGHQAANCPELEKCFNCQEEGHNSRDCPEPTVGRKCKEEGQQVNKCPKPMIVAQEAAATELFDQGIASGGILVDTVLTPTEAIKEVLKQAKLARGLREVGNAVSKGQAQLCIITENCDDLYYKKIVLTLCHKLTPTWNLGSGLGCARLVRTELYGR